jgi:hypothetical protein
VKLSSASGSRIGFVPPHFRKLLPALVFFSLPVALAQNGVKSSVRTQATRVYGQFDSEIVMPENRVPLGRIDPTALQEIEQYRNAVGASLWSEVKATGTISQGNQANLSATLSILQADSFRLDVVTPNGTRSIRISDIAGSVQQDNGKRHLIPPATAKNGLLAFPRLLSPTFPAPQATLLEGGSVQVEGKLLHRILLREAAFSGETALDEDGISAVDLYFDSVTHLLAKSAEYVRLDALDRAHYLRVTTYGDYRPVGGMLIPYHYSQTLNGQAQWILVLSEVDPRPELNKAIFLF